MMLGSKVIQCVVVHSSWAWHITSNKCIHLYNYKETLSHLNSEKAVQISFFSAGWEIFRTFLSTEKISKHIENCIPKTYNILEFYD